MKTQYSFDGWHLDVAAGELRRGSRCTRLQEHSLRLLCALLEDAGKLVTREQLIAQLWPNGVVDFDTGLNTAVHKVRLALEDDAEKPRYVETLPRRGYRFIGTLDVASTPLPHSQASPPPSPSTAAADRPRRTRRGWIAAASGLLLVGASLLASRLRPPGPAAAYPSVAVLPFTDISPRQDQLYFADGMAEDIRSLLVTIPSLHVIGRTSSFSFRDHDTDLRRISQQLGAHYLVAGSVRRYDDQLRIGVQLFDGSSGSQLWSGSFDRRYRDVLPLQQQIASEIARALQVAVGADFIHAGQALRSPDAYTYYLRGRWAIDRGDAGVREAKLYFEQALDRDPTFVKADEALALSYLEELGGRLSSAQVAWPAAVKAAEQALRLDPASSLAHAIIGLERVTNAYDRRAANAELDQALALRPRDPYALYILSWLAFDLGRHPEAVRLQDAALAIDPLNPDSIQNGAYIHYLMGDLDEAERGFRRSIDISPGFIANHRMLGELLLQRGRPQEALAEMEAEPASSRDLGLALAYFALHQRRDSDAALSRVLAAADKVGEFNIALVYAYRGERDQAFAWLERAVAARDLNLGHRLRYDWMLEPLRGDPRYRALLVQTGMAN